MARNTARTALASIVCSCICSSAAWADDTHRFSGQLDLRLVDSDTALSFTSAGSGLSRFDKAHDGVQMGRAFLEYRGRLADTLNAHVILDAYGDSDKNPVDVTEAYLEWRPFPRNNVRWRAKAGSFYLPVSLENGGPGWQSRYSLGSSAINTWLGEEIRTIGTEVSATWTGSHSGKGFDVGAVAGVYGWNDPAGVVIFQRGWALHDRQTALFGGLPQLFPTGTSRHQLELFHEIDGRAGYYAGVQMTHASGITLRALHYDNRGDPGASNGYENAWLTRFNSAGVRVELPDDWTVIAQWMDGDTSVGPSADDRGLLIQNYASWFGLLSRSFGKHRLTVRHDDFYTRMSRGAQIFNSHQDGTSWLLAYTYTHDKHWQGVAEANRIASTAEQRDLLGVPGQQAEKTFQLAVRYSF